MAEFAKSLLAQNIWLNAHQYQQAEIKLALFHQGDNAQPKSTKLESKSKPVKKSVVENKASSMINNLKDNLDKVSLSSASNSNALLDRITKLEKENEKIQKNLTDALKRLEILEKAEKSSIVETKVEAKVECLKKVESESDEDSDDEDLFATDSEEEAEYERIKAERIADYNKRKLEKEAKKGKNIAKSSITFDVKPLDDSTNLDDVEKMIRNIKMDGLTWGAAQKVPLVYTISKLVIICVVEDDKCGSDELIERIEEFEDHVQSVDIANFQKI